MSNDRPEFTANARPAITTPSNPTPPKTAMNLMVQLPNNWLEINKTTAVVPANNTIGRSNSLDPSRNKTKLKNRCGIVALSACPRVKEFSG